MLLEKAKISNLIKKSAEDLNLSKKVVESALEKMKKLPRNIPFNHISVAGALIYICSITNKEARTQREIAKVLKTTEVSIGKCANWILKVVE